MAWLPGVGVMDPGESALQISFIWESGDNNIAPESIKNTNTLRSAKAEIKNFCTSLPL